MWLSSQLVRGDLEKERGVTLPRPRTRSSSAAGCTILPLCWAAPRCVCVRPALLPLRLLPQAFAVNKNVFSVDPPGYIRVEMLLFAKFQVMKYYFLLRSKINVSIDRTFSRNESQLSLIWYEKCSHLLLKLFWNKWRRSGFLNDPCKP